jgi:hypothetical protein
LVALRKVFPSVSKKDELAYAKLENSLRRTRGNIDEEGQVPKTSGKK